MAKQARVFKVSDDEKRKSVTPGPFTDTLDLDILSKVLEGQSLERIADSRFLSTGTISMRLKNTLAYLHNLSPVPQPPEFLREPAKYKDFWLQRVKDYHFRRSLENSETLLNRLVEFYRTLDFDRQRLLLEELQTIHMEADEQAEII